MKRGRKAGRHPIEALTDRTIKAMTVPGRYADGKGLHLLIDASGSKRWVQRIVIGNCRTDLGLGSYPVVSLAKARQAALDNKATVKDGRDPRDVKRQRLAAAEAARERPTFAQAAEAYLAAKSGGFRNAKHRAQWASTIATHALPVLGKLKVDAIETAHVKRVLQPIWGTTTETASRLRARIEAVLDWARVSGHRSGENPARWKGHLDALLPQPGELATVEHHPALPLSQVAPWFAALQKREGMAAQALTFVALTAARSGEVRGATWAEIDIGAGLWAIPATRMKTKTEHRVALTADAVALLRRLPRLDGSLYVFHAPRGGQLSDMSLSAVMRRMQADEIAAGRPGWIDPQTGRPAVPHGLRSSFRDWAAENGWDRDLAEIALAHQVGSDVERAYRRSDMLERRRAMMAAWGAFLRGDSGVAQVVSLRRA